MHRGRDTLLSGVPFLPFLRACKTSWSRSARSVLASVLGCVLASAPLLLRPGFVRADGEASAVLELRFKPTARAQIALWIEDAEGRFLATVGLTEAVAYRGLGNRPGASQMNSGYRWPYGRREGVLPVWASRRASAEGAKQFSRVVFQDRVEGYASRTGNDQSVENYYCLQFGAEKSNRDSLDAVSCATVFNSDKGRYMQSTDASAEYGEPWEKLPSQEMLTTEGPDALLPMHSLYPPRMDITRCTLSGCYDHADSARYADDARDVMPEIDAVTMATPPGDVEQRVLFSVPSTWAAGDYLAFIEVNVEGDYNSRWNDTTFPTPMTSSSRWDSWATDYGYPYRGQPSLVYAVPFTLDELGEHSFTTDMPSGRSSWDAWASSQGQMAQVSFENSDIDRITNDPQGAPGSGVDRLRLLDDDGQRFVVTTALADALPEPTEPGTPDPTGGQAGSAPAGAGAGGTYAPPYAGSSAPDADAGVAGEGSSTEPGSMNGTILDGTGSAAAGRVGAIHDLVLSHHDEPLRAHTWIHMRFRAAESDAELHAYDVRVSTEPITDETTFLRNGRPAKNATDDAEGATSLMLPVDVEAGDLIDSDVGDLVAQTRYFVAVRAKDRWNRTGPISVAEITTKARRFATVTPCFVATAAYGSSLAGEISVLRRVRDRFLASHAPGRALVSAYYEAGPVLAGVVREHAWLRDAVRIVLSPIVAVARALRTD